MIDMNKLPPMDVQLTVRVFSAVVLGLLNLYLLDDTVTQQRWNELPDVLTRILFDGLSSQE